MVNDIKLKEGGRTITQTSPTAAPYTFLAGNREGAMAGIKFTTSA
jgi:hypothetical protein